MHSFSGSFCRHPGSGGCPDRGSPLAEPDIPGRLVRTGGRDGKKRDEAIALYPRGGRDDHRRGFTLLEILLVLALIGLLAAVLVGGGARLMQTKGSTPDDVFWSAVQEARKMALKSEQEVTLKFVDDKDTGKAFVVAQGATTKTFPVPGPTRDLEISFLAQQKGGNLIMVAGTVLETQTIPVVTFYPDGTCTAFKVQFYQGGGTHLITVDPWTCAPMLTAADAAGSSAPKS